MWMWGSSSTNVLLQALRRQLSRSEVAELEWLLKWDPSIAGGDVTLFHNDSLFYKVLEVLIHALTHTPMLKKKEEENFEGISIWLYEQRNETEGCQQWFFCYRTGKT